MNRHLRSLMLGALMSVPFALTGCAPECVDAFDCGAKAKKDGKEYTCVAGACVPGTPFPDGGSVGGGGGETGGGGGATGGGGGGGSTGGGGGTVEDAGSDAGMDDAGMDAGTEDAGTDAGTLDAGTLLEQQVAQARTNALQALTATQDLTAATVTYLKPAVGAEGAGFFVQASPTGPAVFVAVDPSTLTPAPQVGDTVSFTATTYANVSSFHEVTALTGWSRVSSGGSVTSFTQDLTAATTLSANVDALDSELISMRGVLDGGFATAGTGYQAAFFGSVANPVDNVRFRAPTTLVDSLDLVRGCELTVGPTPLWRFTTQAQPSAWVAGDVTIHSCPAPTLVSAAAVDATHVLLTFSRNLATGSVLTDGSQFTFDNGLTASAAAVSGRTVTVTTSAQTGGTSYTATVANSVTDTLAAPLGMPNTATFLGFEVRAVLRINELNANIAGGCDLIELRVVSGGSMNGFKLLERDLGTLVTFTNFTVATNDLIVVHLNGPFATCNPGTGTQETTAKNQQAAATFTANYDTAWDWYSSDTGLTATDNVITLYDATNTIVDAVFVANAPTGTAAAGTETQAALVAAANQWQQVGGGIPSGGFIDDTFRANAALDLDATGTAASGESIRRIDDTDDNDMADWAQGASSFGAINPGQTPFP